MDAVRKDSATKTLAGMYKSANTDPKELQELAIAFSKIVDRLSKNYHDSLTIDIEQHPKYKKLLNYITTADNMVFKGGENRTSDQDHLYCTISYNDKVVSLYKDAPLAVTSPLLYTMIRETLRLGEEAQRNTVLKIDELFKYLL